MTNPLHDAAMAAKRFHDAALADLGARDEVGNGPLSLFLARQRATRELEAALKALRPPPHNEPVAGAGTIV